MNRDFIKDKLSIWMETFVEKPHPFLLGWAPCPYARAARLKNQIEIVFTQVNTIEQQIRDSLELLNNKDVLIMCLDHQTITPLDFAEFVKFMNTELMPRDYVILEDHPDYEEMVNSVKMNFGYCCLLLIQKLSKLTTASGQLKNQGYYDCWSDDNLKDVVTWRS